MFKKYTSLENAYRDKFVHACHSLGAPEWVATEKVHGANFGFTINGGVIQPFRRTGIIEQRVEDGGYDFFGCTPIVEKYREAAVQLEKSVGCPIIIYGELYGERIQKEIQYGEKDFIVFDIYMPCKEAYVNWPMVMTLCTKVGLPTVPEIARGTLDEMLKVSPEFDSIVAASKGFEGQASEGVVIKQLVGEVTLNNGSRAIIKNKSQRFSEKKAKGGKFEKKEVSLTDPQTKLVEDFLQYLNSNRLNNVVSKLGDLTHKDFGKVQGLLVKDAKEEFERDEYAITTDDWEVVRKMIGKEAGVVVRKEWLNLLDN